MCEMNRYETLNAVEKVRGYFVPRPEEDAKQEYAPAFERAKEECLRHLKRQIECIEATDFRTFTSPKKGL